MELRSVDELNSVEELVEHGYNRLTREKYQEAIPYFQKALMLDESPANQSECHFNLGECYLNLGDVWTAAKHYQSVLDVHDYPLLPLIRLTKIAFDQGDEEQALEYLARMLELFPELALERGDQGISWATEGMNQAGSLCLDREMPKRALAFFDQVLTAPVKEDYHEESKREAKYGVARAWDLLGEERLAIGHLEELVAQDDGELRFAEYQRYLALTYVEVGQPQKGIPLMEGVVERARSHGLEEEDFYPQWQAELEQMREQLSWGGALLERLRLGLAAELQGVATELSQGRFPRRLRKALIPVVASVVVLVVGLILRLTVLAPERVNPAPSVPGLTFIYPTDGETLDYEGDYSFKVAPFEGAEEYEWTLTQKGGRVWEEIGGEEYTVPVGSQAHDRFSPGEMKVWVMAKIDGQYAGSNVIVVHLGAQSSPAAEVVSSEPRVATVTPLPRPTQTAEPSTASELQTTSTFTVYADRPWQDTGVSVEVGDGVEIEYLSGQWSYIPGKVPLTDADGNVGGFVCAERMSASSCIEPVPSAVNNALVARIGRSTPMLIGNYKTFVASSSGPLELSMNDVDLSGNAGSVTVRISAIKSRASADNSFTESIPPDGLVRNIWARSRRSYVASRLSVGDKYYTDRDYVIESIPSELTGLVWIKTANDDKLASGEEVLSFDVTLPVKVYVAYDRRVTSLPIWMTSFEDQGLRIEVSAEVASPLRVYTKSFPAGRVALGGNLASGAGGIQGEHVSNYVVLVEPAPSTPTPTFSVTPTHTTSSEEAAEAATVAAARATEVAAAVATVTAAKATETVAAEVIATAVSESGSPPWWDDSYRSRQQLTIGNQADTAIPARYSVKLALTDENATKFYRKSTSTEPGDDIRIVYWDGSKWHEVDRHIESFTSSEVRMWFATQDDIPAKGSSGNYWIYFDNQTATEPPDDTSKIFLWWDDFSLNTVSEYTVVQTSGGARRKGSMSYHSPTGRAKIDTSDNWGTQVRPPISGRNLMIEGDLYFTKVYPASGRYEASVRVVDTDNLYFCSFPVSEYEALLIKTVAGEGAELANGGQLQFAIGTWRHLSLAAYEDRIEAWMDDTQLAARDTTLQEGGVSIGMGQAEGYIDNLRVRKYVSPEPSVFLEAESER